MIYNELHVRDILLLRGIKRLIPDISSTLGIPADFVEKIIGVLIPDKKTILKGRFSEKQVYDMMLQKRTGLSNSEIGDQFNCTRSTVGDYLSKHMPDYDKYRLTEQYPNIGEGSIFNTKFRKDLFEFIKSNPGQNFSSIRKNFSNQEREVGSGHLEHHLKVLEEYNYIKRVKIDNSILYSEVNVDDYTIKLYHIFRKKAAREIVITLNTNKRLERKDINKYLGISRGTIYYHLERLKEFSVLTERINSESSESFYSINPNRETLILEIVDFLSQS